MSKRDRILELRQQGYSNREIADVIGYKTTSGVRGVASKATRQAVIVHDDLYYPSARDINDNGEWVEYLKFAKRRNRMLKIFFWSDMHIPDTNWQAVELARKIRKLVHPDVDFFLGDEHDLDTVSTHWARSENRKRVDAFHEIKQPWNSFHDDIEADYKTDIKVMIGGNHTYGRMENLINEKVPMFADTLIETYIEIARSNRRVKWLGWGDESWINHYHIEHGTRTGENSAKNSLKDAGWSSPRTGGHVHSPSEAWNYGYAPSFNIQSPMRFIVQSVTLPCLCNIHPHYAGNKKKSRWINGVGIAFVNLNGLDVHQHKVIFHTRANGEMAAAYGSEEFTMAKMARSARVAA